MNKEGKSVFIKFLSVRTGTLILILKFLILIKDEYDSWCLILRVVRL